MHQNKLPSIAALVCTQEASQSIKKMSFTSSSLDLVPSIGPENLPGISHTKIQLNRPGRIDENA